MQVTGGVDVGRLYPATTASQVQLSLISNSVTKPNYINIMRLGRGLPAPEHLTLRPRRATVTVRLSNLNTANENAARLGD